MVSEFVAQHIGMLKNDKLSQAQAARAAQRVDTAQKGALFQKGQEAQEEGLVVNVHQRHADEEYSWCGLCSELCVVVAVCEQVQLELVAGGQGQVQVVVVGAGQDARGVAAKRAAPSASEEKMEAQSSAERARKEEQRL